MCSVFRELVPDTRGRRICFIESNDGRLKWRDVSPAISILLLLIVANALLSLVQQMDWLAQIVILVAATFAVFGSYVLIPRIITRSDELRGYLQTLGQVFLFSLVFGVLLYAVGQFR